MDERLRNELVHLMCGEACSERTFEWYESRNREMVKRGGKAILEKEYDMVRFDCFSKEEADRVKVMFEKEFPALKDKALYRWNVWPEPKQP